MAKLYIREDICKGCGLCIEVCPKKILALHKEKINAKGYHPITVTHVPGLRLYGGKIRSGLF